MTSHDICIFQETNLDTNKLDAGYLDFAVCGRTALALSTVNNDTYSRGCTIAWDPNACSVKKVPVRCTAGFEISMVKVEAKFDHLFIISAYCSPSQDKERYAEFFSALIDCIAASQGKLVVVGDLNIQAGRKLHHHRDEGEFIRMIENAGVANEITGITHPSHNNQLDYAFSNVEGFAGTIVDGFGDHRAFSIEVDVQLKTVWVHETIVATNRNDFSNETITALVDEQVDNIIKADLELGEAILELEIFIWELRENLYDYRIIPAHWRISDCSRQMSNTILNENMSELEKRIMLKKNLEADVARRLSSKLQSLDGSERLMSAFTLGSKKKPIIECDVDPDEFYKSVMDDEAAAAASKANVQVGCMADVIKPLEGQRLYDAVKKAKAKWIARGGFSAKFWTYIGSKLFSEKDTGVYSFANVGTVIKDKSNYTEAKAWRMVWKASSLCEKLYDLLRACAVDSGQLNNDAYCIDRSTQRTLTTISTWDMPDERAALGCDFQNAFGLANRETVNELVGFDFVNPKIEFQISTRAGQSEIGVSTAGTGAGRPTGGPAFNILFEHHLSTNPTTKDEKDNIAPFADDSEMRVAREAAVIARFVKSFEEAGKFGLRVHRTGKKGPTLLVREGLVEETITMLDEFGLKDIIVAGEVKFLGLMIHICPNNFIIVARFPGSVISKLTFFVTELGRNFRALQNSKADVMKTFKSLSNAVASLIESRIQYAIAFLDYGSICKAMIIHKRALCSLTGCSFRFFGFKNYQARETDDKTSVIDLFNTLETLESTTYVKLCLVLGRPTMR